MRLFEFLAAYFRTGGGRVVERSRPVPVLGWGETEPPGPLAGLLSGATVSVPAEPGGVDALNAMLDAHYADARAVVDAGRDDPPTAVLTIDPAPIAPAPPAETRVNVDLLRRTLEHITRHPGDWDQIVWWKDNECGTTGCLAGWAVRLQYPDAFMPHAELSVAGAPPRHVQEIARDELGLKPVEAIRLFDGGNDLRDLWTLAAEFTGGAIVPPAELPDGS
jgi:hypothetical protein